KQIESQVGKPPANVAPVTIVDGKTWAIPWYIMAPFWYVWRDEFEKKKVKLPTTFEEAKAAAHALNRPKDNFYGMGQSWNRTADGKKKEEALANHVALPHPAGPEGRRMWAIAMSFGVFKNSKDPEAAMSLVAHLLSPEETLGVMKDSYGQFAPVLDKGRAASKDYFNKNDNYRTFGKAAEWFVPTGWPGPITA